MPPRRSVAVAKRRTTTAPPTLLYSYDWTGSNGAGWSGWTTVVGTVDIQSNKGRTQTAAATNASAGAYLTAGGLPLDYELRADTTIVAAVPGGGTAFGQINVRAVTNTFSGPYPNTSLAVRFNIDATQGFGQLFRVTTGGSHTSLAIGSDIDFVAGSVLRVRIRLVGTNIKIRYWKNAETEPATWNIDYTDATLPTGSNLSLFCTGSNADSIADRWDWDDLTIYTVSSTPGGALTKTLANITSTASGTAGGTIITPEQFGAVGNGSTDDNTAMVNALAACGPTVTLSGTAGKAYTHSAVLNFTATGGRFEGNGCRVHALTQTASAFKVAGTDQYISGVEFSSVNTSRGNTLEHQKVAITGTRAHLVGCTVSSSHAGGFFMYGATDATLDNCHVTGSRADSFHNTFGTTGTRINNCTSTNAGDDGFATVSYLEDPQICSNIIVTNCSVTNNGTRAFSIVGGSDIHYVNISVNGSSAAGLYIAAEASFNSYNVSASTVTVNTIANANSGVEEHGDILFFADGSGRSVNCAVTGVGAANGLISSSDTDAGWHIGGIAVNGGTCAGSVSNMRVTPNDGKTLSANLVGNSTISFSNIAYA